MAEQLHNGIALLFDVVDLLVSLRRGDGLVVVAELGNAGVDDLCRGNHPVGDVVQEGGLHLVVLLYLLVGFQQSLMVCEQRGSLFFLLDDVLLQCLLHHLEVLVEDTHLVVALHVRDVLVVVALGNALCRLGEIGQWAHLLAYGYAAQHVEH